MESAVVKRINDYYGRVMFSGDNPIYDKIGFYNYGYWNGGQRSLEQAQINLVETLCGFLANKRGNILDVACGIGTSTRFLTKYFDPKKIIGINISNQQLSVCRVTAPQCDFKEMDATNLEFSDESFDNIISIEAALHFLPRVRFFQEAHRVLKPGGRLSMSDVLYDQEWSTAYPVFPKENYLPDLAAYEELLSRIGFEYFRVEDTTVDVRDAFCSYAIAGLESQLGNGRDAEVSARITQMRGLSKHFIAACMIYACK